MSMIHYVNDNILRRLQWCQWLGMLIFENLNSRYENLRVLEFQMHLPTTCCKCVAELRCRRVILKTAIRSTVTCGSAHCLGQRGTVRAGWRRALKRRRPLIDIDKSRTRAVGEDKRQETLHAQQQQLSCLKTLISGEHFHALVVM